MNKCEICKKQKRLIVECNLCVKCFNKTEDLCKHTGLDWNESLKIIRNRVN